MKAVVVGAGVIGASAAWNLARHGIDVTVVDAGHPSASATSFGWINASFFADTAHHRLRVAGIAAYGRLLDELPGAPVSMCGALWWEAQGPALNQMQETLNKLGYPAERLDEVAARRLEPELALLPAEILRFCNEGCAEVADLAAYLVRMSRARTVSGATVANIVTRNGAVCGVETSIGFIEADHVIVAAGTGAPEILSSAGVRLPMLTRPGALVTTTPLPQRVNHVLVTPHGEVRQLPDGRLLASAVANHQADDASEVSEPSEDIAQRVLAWLRPMVGAQALDWERVALAYRPMPQDGLPVVGSVGPAGLYVAVMHSGVTLAALMGEAIASEVKGQGGYGDLLKPYRPQRFQ